MVSYAFMMCSLTIMFGCLRVENASLIWLSNYGASHLHHIFLPYYSTNGYVNMPPVYWSFPFYFLSCPSGSIIASTWWFVLKKSYCPNVSSFLSLEKIRKNLVFEACLFVVSYDLAKSAFCLSLGTRLHSIGQSSHSRPTTIFLEYTYIYIWSAWLSK